MEFRSISTHSLVDPSAVEATAELECLGDEIAELAAHLTAATARLLDLIREFDARGGWNSGFRSCAAWLTWRIGLSPIAAREHVRVARALATLPTPAQALAGDSERALRTRHDAASLVLHPHTATPGWLGEPLDVGYAMDVLHPLAVGAAGYVCRE
jgi:hypothetical protein